MFPINCLTNKEPHHDQTVRSPVDSVLTDSFPPTPCAPDTLAKNCCPKHPMYSFAKAWKAAGCFTTMRPAKIDKLIDRRNNEDVIWKKM